MREATLGLLIAFAWGCTTVPPMSAQAHDEAASQEMKVVTEDRARYDPEEVARVIHCGPYESTTGEALAETPPPCWFEFSNPTSHFLAEAAQHERIARAHRAASQALRDKEEKACQGVDERDRHTSPFAHREAIESVSVDVDSSGRTLGATVAFNAVPGLTRAWLERAVACHLAIDAETGNDVSSGDPCPLIPRGVQAQVVGGGQALRVVLRGESSATVDEIVRRAQALLEQPPAGRGH